MNSLRRIVRSKTRDEWTFTGLSLAAGIFFFLFFIDQIVMPFYLRAGQVVTVPDLAGQTWMDAYHLARKNDLLIIRDGAEFSETIPRHRIATQLPVPGSRVKPGRRVYVMISTGPEKIPVPDIMGKKKAAAEDAIRGAGLAIGDESRKRSHNAPSGTVIRQSPDAGTKVKPGAVVNIQVAR